VGSRVRRFLVGLFALAVLAVAPAGAQSLEGARYSQDELDQLLAPIALYPDQLLMQMLIAATYPLEVVNAARFVQENPDLRGDALDEALAGRNWDPSVQSLAAFPQVLAMMNDKLDWMQRLGDAFLVDQPRVMETIQALRQRAQATGNLQSTPQQSVLSQDSQILIEPVQPDYVYVPAYNPYIVYGPWWAPSYPPWFWYPPAIYGYPVGVGIMAGVYFGNAWGISHNHWGWARPDWRGHNVYVHGSGNRFWDRPGRPPPPPGGNWSHEPGHRRGVAYPDLATHDRYRTANPNAVRARQEFRGHERVQPTPNAARPSYNQSRPTPNVTTPSAQAGRTAPGAGLPAPQATRTIPRAAPPGFDPGLSRQQVQSNAQRGQQSRQSNGSAMAPGGRAPSSVPAPSGMRAPSSSAPAPSGSHAPSSAPAPSGAAAPRGGGGQKRP
jgi:hypothetical protein